MRIFRKKNKALGTPKSARIEISLEIGGRSGPTFEIVHETARALPFYHTRVVGLTGNAEQVSIGKWLFGVEDGMPRLSVVIEQKAAALTFPVDLPPYAVDLLQVTAEMLGV